jgi:hypothetical protein
MTKILAQIVVNQMLTAGFLDAQVFEDETRITEVNIDINRASLLRSTLTHKLTLEGIVNGAAGAKKKGEKSVVNVVI